MPEKNVVLLARFCSTGAFDVAKMAAHLRENEFAYMSLARESARIRNRLVRKRQANAFSATFLKNLSTVRDRRVALDLPVTNFETLPLICKFLKGEFASIQAVLLLDHPLRFHNEICNSPLDPENWSANERIFQERQLHRIDRLIDILMRNASQLDIVAGNDALKNEKAVCDLLHVPWDSTLEALPVPHTLHGRNINRLYTLLNMDSIFDLRTWRSMICQFERNYDETKIPNDGQAAQVNELVEKGWRFARKRYPQLEAALDFDTENFIRLPQYKGLTDQDYKNFINVIDPQKRKVLASEYLPRRGSMHAFYEKFFRNLGPEIPVETVRHAAKCAVITFAYNQENYVTQCIESVASQKLDCELEHIIIDDASTDRTPALILEAAKKHPHIKPIICRRKYPSPINIAFSNCHSEYAALLDGDDYFTDPLKLQKQIDFLEKHNECSICFHYARVIFDDGAPSHLYPPESMRRELYSLKDLLQGNPMQTSSVMYRWRFREGLPAWFNPFLVPGDWYWHLLHAETGLAGFIPETMSCYRRHAAAGYATADRDTVKHRLMHGLKELESYEEADMHFNGKYHDDFRKLANGVFANLVEHYAKTGDSAPLDRAVAIFPEFGAEFLDEIKIHDKNSNPDDGNR